VDDHTADAPGWHTRWDFPWSDASTDLGGDQQAPRRLVQWRGPYANEPAIEVVHEITTDGATRCTSVTVTAQPGGRQVRHADLDVPLADLIEVPLARALVTANDHHLDDGSTNRSFTMRDPRLPPAPVARDAARRAQRRGHRRVDDRTLRGVADVYRAALHEGRSPTEAVRVHLSPTSHPDDLIGHRTAGDYIRRARDRDFLGPSLGRGKPGEQTDPHTDTTTKG